MNLEANERDFNEKFHFALSPREADAFTGGVPMKK